MKVKMPPLPAAVGPRDNTLEPNDYIKVMEMKNVFRLVRGSRRARSSCMETKEYDPKRAIF